MSQIGIQREVCSAGNYSSLRDLVDNRLNGGLGHSGLGLGQRKTGRASALGFPPSWTFVGPIRMWSKVVGSGKHSSSRDLVKDRSDGGPCLSIEDSYRENSDDLPHRVSHCRDV